MGAGVLGLPSAMSYLGWPAGIVVLVLSWIISLYTLWQLVKMHEMDGRRFNRYHELGQYAFGELPIARACCLTHKCTYTCVVLRLKVLSYCPTVCLLRHVAFVVFLACSACDR